MGGALIPSIDDVVSTAQGNGAPFEPLITAVESAVEQTDLGKDVENFFEAMPIFMNALDAVADLHPFIGGASASLHVRMRVDR